MPWATREKRNAYQRVYMRMRYHTDEEFRRKQAVRCQAYKAARAGRIKRRRCEGCGKRKVEAHHEDYSRPLEVRWLCRDCHAAAHGGRGMRTDLVGAAGENRRR